MSTRQYGVLRCVLTLLMLSAAPSGFADGSAFYLSWSGWTEQFADPNTGLTILNTLLMPMGGNVEGMGSAYTAVASDAGYIEANPAASSQLRLTEVSLTHRDWISDVSLDSLVYTIRFKDLGLGVAGKFLPIRFSAIDSYGAVTSKAYITETVLIWNASYNFLNSYLNNLTFDGLAAGANLKIAYRGVPRVIAAGQSGFGAMLDLGVLTRFNLLKSYVSRTKNFSVGAALKNIGPFVRGEPLPSLVTLGAAYAVVRPILISLDLNVPFSFAPATYPAEHANVAAGVHIQVTDFVSIQSGLWLRGANPRVALGATVDLERTAVAVNGTLDQTGLHFSVAAKVNLGDRGRGATQAKIDDYFARSIKAYAAGEYESAIELARQVLELRPDHAHAQLVLRLAEDSFATQKDIERKQAEASGLLEQTTTGGAAAPGTAAPAASDEGLEN